MCTSSSINELSYSVWLLMWFLCDKSICMCTCIYTMYMYPCYVHVHVLLSCTSTLAEGDRSLGMVIVSGKVRNKDGSTVEGIFIQKILPGSLTDKDGR